MSIINNIGKYESLINGASDISELKSVCSEMAKNLAKELENLSKSIPATSVFLNGTVKGGVVSTDGAGRGTIPIPGGVDNADYAAFIFFLGADGFTGILGSVTNSQTTKQFNVDYPQAGKGIWLIGY